MEVETILRNGDEKILSNPERNVTKGENEEIKLLDKNGSYEKLHENREVNLEMQNYNTEKSQAAGSYDVDLVWKNITVVSKEITKGCFKKTKIESKTILNGVSGRVKGGECLAILGSTGAGKTTLLNYLSKKIESQNLEITGDILLNNRVIDTDRFNLISSYVMQDDILGSLMTPEEILLFTAKMRLTIPLQEIEERVIKMLKMLNLMNCRKTRIGDNLVRGVSGGERKRTSIAVELIIDPKIIFLDEPTTGLDSYNAFEVVHLLKSLSKQGKIVIFTIHQPASEIFPLLDKICILGLGRTIYFGPAGKKCLEGFKELQLEVPKKENPFIHFMEVTTIMSVENPKILDKFPELNATTDLQKRYHNYITTIADKFEKISKDYTDDSELLDGFSSKMEEHFTQRSIKNSFFFQFGMLYLRNSLIVMRNPKNFAFKIFQIVFTAILFSILFMNFSREYSGIQDRLGLIILSSITFILSASNNQILVFFNEKKVFLRERSNKLYSVFAYYMSKLICDFPLYVVVACLYSIIVYWSTFLNDLYIGILVLSGLGGTTYAFFLSSFINNQQGLVLSNTAFSIPLLIMSGFFTSAENFAPYLIPFKYISLFKYAYQTLIHNEFADLPPFYCFDSNPDTCTPLANRFTFFEPYYVTYIAMVSVIIFFNVLAFIFLYKFAKIRV